MTWWNASYPFRRTVTVTAPSSPVPAGHTVFVELPYTIYEFGKLRTDREDFEVVHGTTVVDRDVSVVDGKFQIKFPLLNELDAGESAEYFVHYGNPTLTNAPTRPDTVMVDYPYVELATGGNISYTRPGDYWVGGKSETRGAVASLAFYGERVRIICEVGIDKGLAEVQVDTNKWEPVNLFSTTTAETSVFDVELEPGYHELRLRVTGERDETSLGTEVKLVKFEYAKQLTVVDNGEEIDDLTWTSR